MSRQSPVDLNTLELETELEAITPNLRVSSKRSIVKDLTRPSINKETSLLCPEIIFSMYILTIKYLNT